jgi:iron complex transport system ATP-binding protein
MEALIELENVYVARGETVVLRNVHLRVERGEHVALLGPNGCGKSTLLKTLTCECYPLAMVEGVRPRVRVLGRERWDLTELKRRLGVVSAEPPGRQARATTGMEAVLTGFFSSSTLWPNLVVTSAMHSRADEVLRMVGGERLRDKLLGQMSAGEQRRVMIGRALAGASLAEDAAARDDSTEESSAIKSSVEMLLLDEPSNALDLVAQRELRAMLRTLAQAGTSIVLITHQIADILPEMKRVVTMREGRIVGDGAKQDMLTSEQLTTLFGGEVEVRRSGEWYSA